MLVQIWAFQMIFREIITLKLTLPFNYVVTSLQYLYMLVINDDVPPPRRSDKPWITLPHQDTQRIKNFMFHFPQNLRLTNLTTFWEHLQIHMALWWLPGTSKKNAIDAILSFTSQCLRIESYYSLRKNFLLVVINR